MPHSCNVLSAIRMPWQKWKSTLGQKLYRFWNSSHLSFTSDVCSPVTFSRYVWKQEPRQLEKISQNLIRNVSVQEHGLSQLPGKTLLISTLFPFPWSLDPGRPALVLLWQSELAISVKRRRGPSLSSMTKSTVLARFGHLLTCSIPTPAQRSCLHSTSMKGILMMGKDTFSRLSRNFSPQISFPSCIDSQAKETAA